MNGKYTIAMPSKGAIAEPTESFLKECGLKVSKPNPRQYVGSMPAIPNLNVLFQRVTDVVYKVADGTAHLGVTGIDVVLENPDDNLIMIHDKLGYGHCQLVVAVPESWVDVSTIVDLAEVAIDFRERKGRNIRVATTFAQSTRRFLHQNGIHHFTIVQAEGAIEAAPTIGYADIIVDLTQTGTTLRENHLKTIIGGTVFESQACIIGNRQALIDHPELLESVRVLLEYVDAALNGRETYQVITDMQGESPEVVATRVTSNPATRGLLGPTVAPIYQADGAGQWHTVTITVSQKRLLEAVEHLRKMGGRHSIVVPARYVFFEKSATYMKLINNLGL